MPERTSWLAAAMTSSAGRGCASSCIFLEPAQNVLDVDHGVVDQLANGDGEPTERHRVNGQPEALEKRSL